MALDRDPNHVFRDFVTAGIPSSGNWNPRKPEIRQLLTEWWQTLIALVADAGELELPNLLISMTVTGGDENNIVAEANLPVPSGPGVAVFSVVIEEANTGPVTINGKPLLSNTGNPLAAGALAADGIYLFLDNGDSYRLLSDYASASIVAAAEDAAERAESAAAGVEYPVSYVPQTLTPEQQEQARENIGLGNSATRDVGTTAGTVAAGDDYRFNSSTASITHVRYKAPFTDLVYDYIVVKNPRPHTVRKVYAPGVAPDGVVTKIPAREFARDTGYQIAINADGWRNADGSPGFEKPLARPNGLQISDGVLYQDWIPGETRDQALVVMRDGTWMEANIDDGISGAQWVANGALWSVCWGRFCVKDGEAIDLTGTNVSNVVSARTVIGKRPNGDIVIALVEGVSGSYGATPNRCGELMLHLGCHIAYIADGGGSTQCWWKNTYAVPSSDTTSGPYLQERGVPSFLVIEADHTPPEYDSGFIEMEVEPGFTGMAGQWPMALRHLGPYIHVSVRINGSFPSGTNIVIGKPYPIRYHSTFDGLTRFVATGNGGKVVGVYTGAARTFSIDTRNFYPGATPAEITYLAGTGMWPAPHTDRDIQAP